MPVDIRRLAPSRRVRTARAEGSGGRGSIAAVTRSVFVPALLALLSFVSSCGGPGGEGIAVEVDWSLVSPTATLPMDVTRIDVSMEVEGEAMPRLTGFNVMNLEDADDNGRREADLAELPPGVDIFITVTGVTASGPAYVAHAGPFVLQHGERRYVDLRMYPANDSALLDSSAFSPRFLHTATTLADGRVLFTGGFETMTSTPCPAGTADVDARCFGVAASDDAALLDANTGVLRATRVRMLAPRAGHTATLLPDGTVLLAGGAEVATLVFEHQDGGFSFRIVPGTSAAASTFEIFDPRRNTEAADVDRDGDPGRGGFVGAADDESELGRLDAPRILHAATLLDGGRVLLAGGLGAPDSFTVWDPQRAGGYGVVGSGELGVSRGLPGAVTLGTGAMQRGWILGGADATDNDGLAEVWRAGTMGALGSTTPASDDDFPDAAGTAHPEFALHRPLTAVLGGGTHALVVGWYGPRCTAGTPAFSPSDPFCAYSPSSLRSYVITASTGAASATMVPNAHAFGAIATLDDGRVVVSGGFNQLTFQAGNTMDLFTGTVAGGMAGLVSTRPPLRAPRALHTTSTVRGHGIVTFGGIAPAADIASVALVGSLEVVYLP